MESVKLSLLSATRSIVRIKFKPILQISPGTTLLFSAVVAPPAWPNTFINLEFVTLLASIWQKVYMNVLFLRQVMLARKDT